MSRLDKYWIQGQDSSSSLPRINHFLQIKKDRQMTKWSEILKRCVYKPEEGWQTVAWRRLSDTPSEVILPARGILPQETADCSPPSQQRQSNAVQRQCCRQAVLAQAQLWLPARNVNFITLLGQRSYKEGNLMNI